MMQATAIKEQMRFALHISTHPFDGFWDLKHEKRGSVAPSQSWTCVGWGML